MEGLRKQFVRPPRKRNEMGRRSWSRKEEEVLIDGLKEVIVTGWKTDNGFRPGYLNVLEQFMRKAFPSTDLKGTPHISGKIHGWKKNYGTISSMLLSGIGFNHSTKMIDAKDDTWDHHAKVDPNSKGMRCKSWPFYDDWCEIFGKDRATGEEAEGFVDATNNVLGETNPQGKRERKLVLDLGIQLCSSYR